MPSCGEETAVLQRMLPPRLFLSQLQQIKIPSYILHIPCVLSHQKHLTRKGVFWSTSLLALLLLLRSSVIEQFQEHHLHLPQWFRWASLPQSHRKDTALSLPQHYNQTGFLSWVLFITKQSNLFCTEILGSINPFKSGEKRPLLKRVTLDNMRKHKML